MKAKIKCSGKIIDVIDGGEDNEGYYEEVVNTGMYYHVDELEFINNTDWDTFRREQLIQTAHEMLVVNYSSEKNFKIIIAIAETFVYELIKRLKKMEHERV